MIQESDALRVWNTSTGALLQTITNAQSLAACAIPPGDDTVWAADSGGRIKQWRLRPSEPVSIPFNPTAVASNDDSAVSADCSRIAILTSFAPDAPEGPESTLEIRDANGALPQAW